MKEKIPFRFFIIAFAWSWIFWLPLILAGFGIIPINKELLTSITVPVSIVASFGPLLVHLYH